VTAGLISDGVVRRLVDHKARLLRVSQVSCVAAVTSSANVTSERDRV
jgi:hypothetical protein